MNIKNILYGILFCCVGWLHAESTITVTVWVHGTYPALKLLAHKKSPFRSWIYVPAGLSLAKDLPSDYYFHTLGMGCHQADEVEYNKDHFYLYGWHSSNMRPSQRKQVGRQLYEDLDKLLQTYQKSYDHVKLRLVGFSHGGNVILHSISSLPFTVENIELEVILIATPIQESTRNYINNPCITYAYSFYSNADWVQRIDIQKLHHDAPKGVSFWSQRMFLNSDNVTQVHLTVDGKDIGHGQFRPIVQYLPFMMKEVQKLQNKNRIDLDFALHK